MGRITSVEIGLSLTFIQISSISLNGVTKVVICAIMSVGWCI